MGKEHILDVFSLFEASGKAPVVVSSLTPAKNVFNDPTWTWTKRKRVRLHKTVFAALPQTQGLFGSERAPSGSKGPGLYGPGGWGRALDSGSDSRLLRETGPQSSYGADAILGLISRGGSDGDGSEDPR